MDSTRATRPTGVTGAAAVLKAAAVRAKTAAGAAGAEPRKRKRGALQDISNSNSNSHARGTAASAAHAAAAKKPLGKPTAPATTTTARGVKRPASSQTTTTTTTTATANVRVRSTKTTTTTTAATKRRRENAAEESHGKVQTSLLSFQSIAPLAAKTAPKETKTKIEREQAPQDDAANASTNEVDMECEETLKTEPSEPEPTPTASAPTRPAASKTAPKAKPTATVAGSVPPYEPRPFAFKFDHRDSGFDAETYKAQIRDIDEPYLNSAIHCVKLVRDMDRFHRQHEMKYHPEPDYIGNVQLDINEKMRTILVDWLVEVGEEYELDSQTFHKTVNLVDRCLAQFKINRKQFQLLGCACMMIAAKFEEVYGPNVDEFVYISDQTYTSEEMLEMEAKVLQALEYRIASTTCHGFLPRFTRAGCTTDKQKSLVQYLCDFAILYYHMLQYRPSLLAAAAVYLSRVMTNEEHPWTPTLHHFTQFNAWELKECVLDLQRLHRAESEIVENQRDKAKAVSEKYVSEKFHGVSATPSVDEAALEKSFEAYEMPKHMRRKAETAESSGSGSE